MLSELHHAVNDANLPRHADDTIESIHLNPSKTRWRLSEHAFAEDTIR